MKIKFLPYTNDHETFRTKFKRGVKDFAIAFVGTTVLVVGGVLILKLVGF